MSILPSPAWNPPGRIFWLLAVAVLVGAGLRLVWPDDMEYKEDEVWTYTRTESVGKTEAFPWFGMPSSKKLLNPGMSVWVFLGLARLFETQTPVELGQAVQLSNVAALAVLAGFVF